MSKKSERVKKALKSFLHVEAVKNTGSNTIKCSVIYYVMGLWRNFMESDLSLGCNFSHVD